MQQHITLDSPVRKTSENVSCLVVLKWSHVFKLARGRSFIKIT
jgi:hypothetical protein